LREKSFCVLFWKVFIVGMQIQTEGILLKKDASDVNLLPWPQAFLVNFIEASILIWTEWRQQSFHVKT